MKSLVATALMSVLFLSTFSANARTHTWIPRATAQSDGGCQTVVVVGMNPSIDFGPGEFDDASFNESVSMVSGGNGIAVAINGSIQKFLQLSHTCSNPLISSGAQNTTSGSDLTDRWLAAQEVYNSMTMTNAGIGLARASNALQIVINGYKYSGFKVYYADGGSEVWAINPGYATSSVKLLDTPMPGSLTEGNGESCGKG